LSPHRIMSVIAASELIINNRGAVYHLDCRPDEIAPTIITVGDPDRVAAVSKHFDEVHFKNKHREFITHTGRIGKLPLTVTSTGIGPDNIDIVINELDALTNIDFESRTVKKELRSLRIIRVGTSGSLQKEIPVDSFVASTHGLGLDNLLHFYQQKNNEEEKQLLHAFHTHTQMQQAYVTGAGMGLLKEFVKNFHQGITVTCPGFYGPQGRVLRMGLAQPQLIDRLTSFRFGQHRISNFEMETSAIYGMGKILGHQCVSLSAIVANRISKTFSADGQAAVEKLIQQTLQILSTV
jgi:uridine phosphorylase